MKTAILTIPSQEHRLWALFGHLQTLGFPVRRPQNRFFIYNGFNYYEYLTRWDIIQDMIADGHTKYGSLLSGYLRTHPDSHYEAAEWGMLNIMRKIIEKDSSMLVVENDVFFRNLPVSDVSDSYDFLDKQWDNLVETVGYENIYVAQFTVDRPNLDEFKSNTDIERIDDFWVRGSCAPGQTANIYTPHGAKYILEEKCPDPIIERALYSGFDDLKGNILPIPNVFSSYQGIVNLHLFSNFDSPHVHKSSSFYFDLFKGEQL